MALISFLPSFRNRTGSEVARKTVMPHISWDANYLIMVVSIIGTCPGGGFYLQSGVVEKGLRKENLWASRIDVILAPS